MFISALKVMVEEVNELFVSDFKANVLRLSVLHKNNKLCGFIQRFFN